MVHLGLNNIYFSFFRRFFKDMPQVALDKKSNFELLEKESGLKRFLPKSVIDSMKVTNPFLPFFAPNIWAAMSCDKQKASLRHMRTAQVQTRLHKCAVWSEPWLFVCTYQE